MYVDLWGYLNETTLTCLPLYGNDTYAGTPCAYGIVLLKYVWGDVDYKGFTFFALTFYLFRPLGLVLF